MQFRIPDQAVDCLFLAIQHTVWLTDGLFICIPCSRAGAWKKSPVCCSQNYGPTFCRDKNTSLLSLDQKVKIYQIDPCSQSINQFDTKMALPSRQSIYCIDWTEITDGTNCLKESLSILFAWKPTQSFFMKASAISFHESLKILSIRPAGLRWDPTVWFFSLVTKDDGIFHLLCPIETS